MCASLPTQQVPATPLEFPAAAQMSPERWENNDPVCPASALPSVACHLFHHTGHCHCSSCSSIQGLVGGRRRVDGASAAGGRWAAVMMAVPAAGGGYASSWSCCSVARCDGWCKEWGRRARRRGGGAACLFTCHYHTIDLPFSLFSNRWRETMSDGWLSIAMMMIIGIRHYRLAAAAAYRLPDHQWSNNNNGKGNTWIAADYRSPLAPATLFAFSRHAVPFFNYLYYYWFYL